jgi:hypothetical protein
MNYMFCMFQIVSHPRRRGLMEIDTKQYMIGVFLHEECILWTKYKDGEQKMDVMVQANPI